MFSLLLYFLLKNGSCDVFLSGDESRVAFRDYDGVCDLVKPIGGDAEQEKQLFKYYQTQTSRLIVDKKKAAFTIKYPTYREALQWSCCKGTKTNGSPADCHSVESHKVAKILYSPVQITQVTRFFTNDAGHKELASVIVAANIPRPSFGKPGVLSGFNLQLIIDADPSSCGGSSYARRFNFFVPSSLPPEIDQTRFISFSDAFLPQNCKISLFLQKSCADFQEEGSYSYSDDRSDVNPTEFNTTYFEDGQSSIIGRYDVKGVKLDVQLPSNPATMPMTYHKFEDRITTQLPEAGPVIRSCFSDRDEFLCEAFGYPLPEMMLLGPVQDEIIAEAECDAECGWNCRRCRWRIQNEKRILSSVRCVATNQIASVPKTLPINDHITHIISVTPVDQKVSIFGDSNHQKSVVKLVATVEIGNWPLRRAFLTEKSRTIRSRSTNGIVWSDKLNQYKQVLQEQVKFTKDGRSQNFGCGKRRYSVDIGSDCLMTSTCQAKITLEIMMPDVDDSGEYRVELINPPARYRETISYSVAVKVTDDPTEWALKTNSTEADVMDYNQFKIHNCSVLNSDSIDCKWWPAWHTKESTKLFSIHSFDQDNCLDGVAPYNASLSIRNSDSIPPSFQHFIIRDLISSHFYKVIICAWEIDKGNKVDVERGTPVPVLEGRGNRKCLTWARIIEMPPDRPKFFIDPPRIVQTREETIFRYSADDINDLSGVEIDQYQVIYRLRDPGNRNRFTSCLSCPSLRFVSDLSQGSTANVGPLPLGMVMMPFARGFNRQGFGPYTDDVALERGREIRLRRDPSVTSFEIHFDLPEVTPIVGLYEIKWNIKRDYFVDRIALIMNYDGNREIVNLDDPDRCWTTAKDVASCRLVVPAATNIVIFETFGGYQIMVIFLSKKALGRHLTAVRDEGARNLFHPPTLIGVNRTEHEVQLKFLPRTLLFQNYLRAIVFNVDLAFLSDFSSPLPDGTTFHEKLQLSPRVNDDLSLYELTYEVRSCRISSLHDRVPRVAPCHRAQYSDVTISVTQLFDKFDDLESPPSLKILIEPDLVGVKMSESVTEYLAAFPIPTPRMSPVAGQNRYAIVDFAEGSPRVGFGPEVEAQVQVVPKRSGFDCDRSEAFDDVSDRIYLTSTFVLPRQRNDGVHHFGTFDIENLKGHVGNKEISERKTLTGLPKIVTAKIRQFGGVDGYQDHCEGSFINCIKFFEAQSQRRPLTANGMLELRSIGERGYDKNECNYCYRARYVFRGIEEVLAGRDGAQGPWSSGQHYQNVESLCSWSAQIRKPISNVVPAYGPETAGVITGPVDVFKIELNQLTTLFGILVIVAFFISIMMIVRQRCFKKNDTYVPGSGGHQSNRAELGFTSGRCHAANDAQLAQLNDWASTKSLSSVLTGSSSHSHFDSVGYALLPADSSLSCSSLPLVVNDISGHLSSFDSGIDRRSVTPPVHQQHHPHGEPPALISTTR